MKKVIEILFDEETRLPTFVLEDGSKYVGYQSPTGSCWVTGWNKEKKDLPITEPPPQS